MNDYSPKILSNKLICRYDSIEIYEITIFAPLIARHYKPGQFVILMINEKSERIPLTIVKIKDDFITLIYQVIGYTTKLLSQLKEGDTLYHIVGPLGTPTEIKLYGKVIIVAGGVGAAEAYPVTLAFKKEKNFVSVIVGAKNKSLIILEDDFKKIADEFYVTTDDGSYGEKGFVTDVLIKVLESKKDINLVYAVGPVIMMQKVSEITKKYNVKTLVSLNTIMVDGTGMCGSCRITCENKIKYVCFDGPEFDAHSIDWDEILSRNNAYLEKEKEILRLQSL
ncbi:MAG: sulfide/dihydroorotate dehydrogenase-like FAD/NAD-binding protein [Endomicrobiia bacterium]